MYIRTHALEFLFELSHVVAVGDTKVVVGVVSLKDAVGRSGGANGKDGCWTLGSLGLSDYLNGSGHFDQFGWWVDQE